MIRPERAGNSNWLWDAIPNPRDDGVLPSPYSTKSVESVSAGGDVWLRDSSTGRVFSARPLELPENTNPELLARVAQLQHPSLLPIHEVGAAYGEPLRFQEVTTGRTLESFLEVRDDLPRVWGTVFAAGWADLVRGFGSLALLAADLLGAGIHPQLDDPRRIWIGTDGSLRFHAGDLLAPVCDPSASYVSLETILLREAPPLPSEEMVIYSLASMLHHSLTGSTPFGGRDAAEVAHRMLADEPTPEVYWESEIPIAVQELIQGALRTDPRERPATLRGFAHMLSAALLGERTWSRRKLRHLCLKNRPPWVVGAFVAALFCLWGLWFWRDSQDRSHVREQLEFAFLARPLPIDGEEPAQDSNAPQFLLDLRDDLSRYRRDSGIQIYEGWARLRAMRLPDALRCFQRAVHYRPDSIPGWVSLGIARLELRDRGGRRDLLRGLELAPQGPDDWLFHGAALLYERDFSAALVAFRELTARAPQSFAGWFHVALCAVYSGATEWAGVALERCEALQPHHLWTAWLRAQLAANRGDPQEALAEIARFETRFLGCPPVQLRVGQTLIAAGHGEKGQEWIDQARRRIGSAHAAVEGEPLLDGPIEWRPGGAFVWPGRRLLDATDRSGTAAPRVPRPQPVFESIRSSGE